VSMIRKEKEKDYCRVRNIIHYKSSRSIKQGLTERSIPVRTTVFDPTTTSSRREEAKAEVFLQGQTSITFTSDCISEEDEELFFLCKEDEEEEEEEDEEDEESFFFDKASSFFDKTTLD